MQLSPAIDRSFGWAIIATKIKNKLLIAKFTYHTLGATNYLDFSQLTGEKKLCMREREHSKPVLCGTSKYLLGIYAHLEFFLLFFFALRWSMTKSSKVRIPIENKVALIQTQIIIHFKQLIPTVTYKLFSEISFFPKKTWFSWLKFNLNLRAAFLRKINDSYGKI